MRDDGGRPRHKPLPDHLQQIVHRGNSLVLVNAPHFCAGLEFVDGKCIVAAPIVKWAVGLTVRYVLSYFHRKGYEIFEVERADTGA